MRPVDPRLVRRSATVRRLLAVCVALGIATAVVAAGQAWFLADVVAGLAAAQPVVAGALGFAACLAIRGALTWAGEVTATRAASTVKAELRRELIVAALDADGPEPPRGSRLATLVGDGLDGLDGYIGRFLPQVVVTVVVPLLVIAVLVVVDPLSAVIAGLTVPLVALFLALVGLATRDATDRRWGELARLGRHVEDVLDGIVVLKVFGRRQERALREVGARHRRVTVETLRHAFMSSLVLELFSTLSVALVAVATGLRVVEGHQDLRTGLFVLVLVPEAYAPLRRLGRMFHDSTDGLTVADEALARLDRPHHAGSRVAPPLPGIVIDGLRVSYDDRDGTSLRVDDEIVRPGETVALVGPSGSGKSTLLSVLLGFTAPSAGRVRVGDVDLRDLDLERWRRRIAWVPQFPALVSGTVLENVRIGAPEADDADLLAALRHAGAADLDPEREVGEGGRLLSAGERRRVGVARALARVRTGGVDLVLMDEPTAGLDADRERVVIESLRALHPTVLVVAHRPETIAAADRVIRL